MALKKTFIFSGNRALQSDEVLIDLGEGETSVEFYIKVDRISGNKDKIDIRVSFQSPCAKMEKDYSFDYDISGKNPIAQSYEYLKSLPEFVGALDC